MSFEFTSSVNLPIVNGVGTVGYTVFDSEGQEVTARTTSGIVRLFAGADYGIYSAEVTVGDSISSGTVLWDDASGSAVPVPFFAGVPQGNVSLGDYTSELDATWGGSTADSYISLEDADASINSYILDTTAWSDATGRQQDAALRMATVNIDTVSYLGGRMEYTQSLKFPRFLPADIPLTDDQIKAEVRIATVFQANFLIENQSFNAEHARNMAAGLKQLSNSIGPIRDQYTYTSAAPTVLSQDALRIMAKYKAPKRLYRA